MQGTWTARPVDGHHRPGTTCRKARPLRRIYGPDADIGAKAMDVALCRLKRRGWQTAGSLCRLYGIVTLATVRRGGNRSVLRQAVAATDTLHVSIACSLRNRCVEAVVRWRQMLNVL